MAWIRLDDDYIAHPKFLALSDRAFRLWHEGLAYCRKLMSDGAIPAGALKTFRSAQKGAIAELATPLRAGAAPLWDTVAEGYHVHDYLQWNAPKALEVSRRAASQERLKQHRLKRVADSVAERVADGAGNALRNAHSARFVRTEPDPVRGSDLLKDDRVTARSKRPIFAGQRLTVFEWMLDDCDKTLGPHAEAFDLHRFFFDLDARFVADGTVLPKRDGGAVLQAELLAECQRRGLPLHVAHGAPEADGRLSPAALQKAVAKRLGFES